MEFITIKMRKKYEQMQFLTISPQIDIQCVKDDSFPVAPQSEVGASQNPAGFSARYFSGSTQRKEIESPR